MTEIITMSSKGQIVVPKDIRERLGIDSGSNFAVFGADDLIVFQKITAPTAKEVFSKLNRWGTKLAKEKGWKESEVLSKIHKGRGLNIGKHRS